MTRSDLKSRIATATGVQPLVVSKVVDAMFDELKHGFIHNEKLEFRGFGTFKVQHCAAKPARVISTGERLVIPAHNKIKFEVSKEILREMNK